jgi:mRNA interferase RelE/StbE
MSFTVSLSNRAEKGLRRIPAADLRRIERALEAMETDPLSGDVVKLRGTEAFRRRVGGYRILFGIDFKRFIVGIIDIQRRTTTTY